MIVTVHLHTVLQRQTPEGVVSKLEVPLAPESTLKDLLAHLEIDFPLDSMLLVLNGHLVEADHELHDTDQVNLMPAISGGETSSEEASMSLNVKPTSTKTVDIMLTSAINDGGTGC